MLNTYDQDDINAQAIRELTTEVDQVKQRVLKSEQNINSLDSRLDTAEADIIRISDDIIIKNLTISTTITLEAGGYDQNGFYNLYTDTPQGYTPVLSNIRAVLDGDGNLIHDAFKFFESIALTPAIGLAYGFINLSSSSVTIRTVRAYVVFQKTRTA